MCIGDGVVVGGGTSGYQTLSNAIALNLAEPSHQGRVQSLLQLSFAGFGIAALPLGLLAEAIGRRQAMVSMGLAATVAIVVYWMLEGSDADTIEAGIPHEPAPAPSKLPPGNVSSESTQSQR